MQDDYPTMEQWLKEIQEDYPTCTSAAYIILYNYLCIHTVDWEIFIVKNF